VFNYVFISGKIATSRSARISVKDRGFLYGDGLYETIRSYKGYLFMLDEHIERLFHSLIILKYKLIFDKDYVKEAIENTIKKNSLDGKDAYIKVIVTRGIQRKDLYFNRDYKPELVVIAEKLMPPALEDYTRGIKIISSSIRRPSMGSPVYVHKLINYFENVYARNEAYHNEAKEAVFLTKDHLVLEGASSNFFYVKRNIVYTPPLTQNILAGITRKVVIDLCRENGIKVKERSIHYRDFINADEIFKTSSIAGIVPIRKVDRFKLSGKVPGNITSKTIELFKRKTNLKQYSL